MFAFTLAEVLITLVIIGVIAAITVPTLMNKTNNQEYVSRLKKAYSTLSQATNLIIAEEGTPRADKGGWTDTAEHTYNLYKKHLLNAKDCSSSTNCFMQLEKGGDYYYLDGEKAGLTWNANQNYKKLVLADGTQVMFDSYWKSDNCSSEPPGSSNVCGSILVDINGAKKPNKYARDVFVFVIKENGLYPRGCDNPNYCPYKGQGCACKVLREGAMNY